MAKRPKTGFDKYFDRKTSDPRFATGYAAARSEIDAIDRIIRHLDAARLAHQISKAELARAIGARPEILRRLFTAKDANPTISTLVKLADALGFKLALIPARGVTKLNRAKDSRHHATASAG